MKKLLLLGCWFFLHQFSTIGQSQVCDAYFFSSETPENFTPGSMNEYHSLKDALDQLQLMRSLYPHLVSEPLPIHDFLTEGVPDNSVSPSIGSNPIIWLKISDNPDIDEQEPEVLYDSNIHAFEWQSHFQQLYFMWYLLENYDTNSEIKKIVDNTELYFIPLMNPDGLLYTEVLFNQNPTEFPSWKSNRKDYGTEPIGVNLNRNYSHFIDGIPGNHSWDPNETNPGPEPFSEQETQAVKWFVEQHDFVLNITNHTKGGDGGLNYGDLIYPFNYNDSATVDDEIFKTISAEFSTVSNYNAGNYGFETSGMVPDFMYGTVGTHNPIFSFLTEIPLPRFDLPYERRLEMARQTLKHNLFTAKLSLNHGSIRENGDLITGISLTPKINFEIQRLGITGNGNYTVQINPVSQNIIDANATFEMNDLALIQKKEGSIVLALDPTITSGDSYTYDLILNDGLFNTTKRITKIYGEPQIIYDNPGIELIEDFDVVGTEGWSLSDEDYFSPPTAIRAESIRYEPDTLTITTKRSYDLSLAKAASVSFQTKWGLHHFSQLMTFEVSEDRTAWDIICGPLSKTSAMTQHQMRAGYFNSNPKWIEENINLNPYLGKQVYFRFKLVSTYKSYTGDFFLIDDLKLNMVFEDILLGDTKLFVYPNPVENILYIDTDYKNYDLLLFDLLGNLLVKKEQLFNSQHLDHSGYAQGIYLLAIRSNQGTKTFKIIKQ